MRGAVRMSTESSKFLFPADSREATSKGVRAAIENQTQAVAV
jgi:hypothetical protein